MERRFLKVASGLVLALVLILGSGVLMAPPSVWGSGAVNISIVPTSSNVAVGDVFSVNVVLEAGTQPVFGAAAHINFDPAYLEVQSIDKGATLQVSNATSKDFWAACGFDPAGAIDCSWARSGPVEGLPSGNFTLVTIHLKALAKTDSTSLSFIFNPPLRNTDIMDHSLNSIIGAHSDGGVVIGGAAGTISKIVFTTATQTLAAGQVSAVMTIQTQDSFSNAVNVTSNTTISLFSNSTSGKFYSDAAGSTQISSVTINSGTSSASFYYKDTTVGTPTIRAAESPSQGWTLATQVETVNAGAISKLAFTTSARIGSLSLTAGVVSGVVTIQTQNAYGSPVSVTSNTTITLNSTSGNGKFYSDAAGTSQITSVTISSGTSSASFYYKDTKAGSLSITAVESPSQGWTDASQAENVKAAAASKLVVSGITDPVKAGTACSVTVTAVDAYGNTDTTYAGTIHFTSSDAQATLPSNYPFNATADNGSHSFVGGVILETAGEQSVTATDTVTSSITGQQAGITVTGGGGGTNWGAIIGGIIGGLLLIGIIVYLLRRRQQV